MKTSKYILALCLAAGSVACSDFDEININPNGVSVDEASARYFLTDVQAILYSPNRYPYWRAHLIHADRYAGHFTFGHSSSWWSDELGYTYHSGYTDAAWDWLASYFGTLDNYLRLTKPGGEFENEEMYAVGKIMKGLYFQMYTDAFGELPYTQVGDLEVLLPQFDTQETIYKGVIAELNEAMAMIGDAERTGIGLNDLGNNDIFFGGDLQKWKKLANTLKLRMAIRALGATGNDFSATAITEALNAPLLATKDENALLEKDNVISQWDNAVYGDVWYNFGEGSDWKVSMVLLEHLKENVDPRLEKYAKPAPGGEVTIGRPEGITDALWQKRTGFILNTLEEQEVPYTTQSTATGLTITIPKNTYYVGQPVRLNGFMASYARYNLFSNPAEIIIQKKNEGKPIFPEIVMTTAEAYFLQAHAAVMGLGSGNAQELFSEGIRQAMLLWGVEEGAINTYLANADMAKLEGTQEEKIRKISLQRWIAAYTDGFEAWAIVRETGYPAELAGGVSDIEIFGPGDINGAYPQRLQYGNAAKDKNGNNLNQALSRQGPDKQDVKLWFAKK